MRIAPEFTASRLWLLTLVFWLLLMTFEVHRGWLLHWQVSDYLKLRTFVFCPIWISISLLNYRRYRRTERAQP